MKKLLAMLIAAMLILSIGVVAMAEDGSFNLAGAIESVEDGGTVTVTQNVTVKETIAIDKNVTVVLQNGAVITGEDVRVFHVKKGTLTLTGNGTVESTHQEGGALVETSSVIRVGDNGTGDKVDAGLVIDENVTISTNRCYGVSVFGSGTNETVTVKGKIEVSAPSTAAAIAGNGLTQYAGTVINIEGGTLTSESGLAIYHPQEGTLNINGGTIKGTGGIEAKSGTINISGGALIEATAEATIQNPNADGPSSNGYAIAAVTNSAYTGNVKFNIKSGNCYGGPVAELTDEGFEDESKQGDIEITAGIFSYDVSEYVVDDSAVIKIDANNGNGFIVTSSDTVKINAGENGVITVLKASENLSITANEGATVKNESEEDVTVNGEKVASGESVTIEAEPAKPVYRDTVTIEIGGEKAETVKTDKEENPNTGAPAFINVAATVVVVAIVGAVVLKRK